MSSSLAFVFPGQGSQATGMLSDLAAHYSEVETTFAEASDGAGMDLWALVREGPAETLNRTENTQPALLAASVAVWRVWEHLGGTRPACLSGHSLGEYSALVCAGAVSLHDAAALVTERGRLMQAAVPSGIGTMAAVLGVDDETVADVCRKQAGDEVVSPANFNAPGQVVIAGHVAAVDRALAELSEQGAKKTVKLDVSVPSHTSLMHEAADGLHQRMQQIEWATPAIPVIQNADATAADNVEGVLDALRRQLFMPVRWSDCVRALMAHGVTHIGECGPGKVLAGLGKRIDRSLTTIPLGTPDKLETAQRDWA